MPHVAKRLQMPHVAKRLQMPHVAKRLQMPHVAKRLQMPHVAKRLQMPHVANFHGLVGYTMSGRGGISRGLCGPQHYMVRGYSTKLAAPAARASTRLTKEIDACIRKGRLCLPFLLYTLVLQIYLCDYAIFYVPSVSFFK